LIFISLHTQGCLTTQNRCFSTSQNSISPQLLASDTCIRFQRTPITNYNLLHSDIFIEETLNTLALLFPESDKKTKAWFLKKQAERTTPGSFLDSTARRCGNLNAAQHQIHRFNYWRERLIILKTVFDESNPRTLRQMWKDRWKVERWFTFWVAIFIVLPTIHFGLAQTIEGAIQVSKAYHPS